MKSTWQVALMCVAAMGSLAVAADPIRPLPSLSAEALAERIDAGIAARWKDVGATPAAQSSDSEFLRRIFLDLGGRIPRVGEVRDFLEDPSPDKRRRIIEELLRSPYFVSHFTNVWRALMLPEANNPFGPQLAPSLEAWLKKRLRENVSYDQMVREVLTVTPRMGRMGVGGAEPTPAAFNQANENKPENLAAATSRLFLGVKLECAQCHNHPFAKWTRQQFWEYAAFFRPPSQKEMAIPQSEKFVQARFLDGSAPKVRSGESGPRETLADWMTTADNPFFARAAANRLWAHFFGVGLIDPIDEESDENKPSHPALLTELARQLALHNFDLKYLMKAIVLSKTYQLSSSGVSSTVEPQLFLRMPTKGLTPEQLYDSIALATGFREPVLPENRFGQINPAGPRAEFLNRFANLTDKRTEYQTSILQALSLMNGKFVADATSLERSETLAGVVDAPFLDTPGRVEVLFLATVSRRPRAEEQERFVKYVESGGARNDPKRALADVFWVLLNTSEFILNH